MKTYLQTSETDFQTISPQLHSYQRDHFKNPKMDNPGKMGWCLWVAEPWITVSAQRGQIIYPPGEIVPNPDEPEILPDPSLPEEEEYLPDEEENPIERPRREIDDPYQPDREEDFPPEKETEWPQEEPKK